MLRDCIRRLLPRTGKGAFFTGFGVALAGGLFLVWLLLPLTGKGCAFGTRAHDGYLQIARNLIAGNGWVFEPGGPPVMHRPPVCPLVLVPVALLPEWLQPTAVVLLHAVIVGAICWLLFDLTARMLGGRAAPWAVALFLLFPWLHSTVRRPMSTLIQALLVLLVVHLMARFLLARDADDPSRGGTKWAAFSLVLGLAMAAAVLTHGTMLLAAPLLLAGMTAIGLRIGKRGTIPAALLAGTVIVVVVAPWTWRNYQVTGHFIPVATNAGFAYFLGNSHWQVQDGRYVCSPEHFTHALRLGGIDVPSTEALHFRGVKDVEMDRRLTQNMIQHMRANPGFLAKKIALNGVEYYFPVCYEVLGPDPGKPCRLFAVRALLSLWHLGFFCLALVGIWKAKIPAARTRTLLMLGTAFVLMAPYLPFFVAVANDHYVMSTIPLLALSAAGGLTALFPTSSRAAPGLPSAGQTTVGRHKLAA